VGGPEIQVPHNQATMLRGMVRCLSEHVGRMEYPTVKGPATSCLLECVLLQFSVSMPIWSM